MIVEDQLDRGAGRIGGIEKLEEFDELAAAVAIPDERVDLAGEQIDPGQQAERAMAFVNYGCGLPAQPKGRRSLRGRFWKKPCRCRCGPLLCRLHQQPGRAAFRAIWLLFPCFVGQIATEFGTLGCEHDGKFRSPVCARRRPRQNRRVYSQAASQSSSRGQQNSQHALDMAQKLSHQLRAAEQRITDLQAEVERHRDRAERAEQWLHKVYSEIEDRFIRDGGRARTMAR